MKIDKYIRRDMSIFNNLHPYKQAGYSVLNKLSNTSPFHYFIKYIKKGGSKKGILMSDGQNYDFRIKHNHLQNDDTIELFIGKTNKCLISFITYNKNTGNIHPQMVLQSFGYFSDCSEGNKIMKRGEGTEKMLRLFIDYVRRDLGKYIKTIILSDNAFFECNIPTKNIKKKKYNINIPMATLYFFKYGMLYYPKFGFTLYKNDPKTKNIKRLLNLYNLNDQVTYSFIEEYVKYIESINTRNYIINSENDIQHLVDTLSDFDTIKHFLQTYHFPSCELFRDFLEYLCLYLVKIDNNKKHDEHDNVININYFSNMTYLLIL